MSAGEFGRWLAFFEQEPIGPGVTIGLWAETMAALYTGPATKQDKTRWTAADFARPRWAAEAPEPRKPAGIASARAHIQAQRLAHQQAREARKG